MDAFVHLQNIVTNLCGMYSGTCRYAVDCHVICIANIIGGTYCPSRCAPSTLPCLSNVFGDTACHLYHKTLMEIYGMQWKGAAT